MTSFDISIAGEINLDLILYGLPPVMPLERELLAEGFEVTLGSSSAILAHNLAALGARVAFVTRAGKDALGALALQRLRESGADLSRVVFDRDGVATGVTLLLPHGSERHILTYPGTMARMTVADLDVEYLKRARHFHLSSLFLQRALAPDLPRLFRELKSAGLTLSLDTNDDPADEWGGVLEELLGLVDVLLPNQAEAYKIARCEDFEDAVSWLARRVPCVAVKRGREGALVLSGGRRIAAPALNVTTVDTIGAGDSFNAGFLHAWLRGLPLEECARCGNIAGALSTQRPGGSEAFRDRGRMTEFLSEHHYPFEAVRR
jgi:sugar/nucleoside kinase (ribokinase family)